MSLIQTAPAATAVDLARANHSTRWAANHSQTMRPVMSRESPEADPIDLAAMRPRGASIPWTTSMTGMRRRQMAQRVTLSPACRLPDSHCALVDDITVVQEFRLRTSEMPASTPERRTMVVLFAPSTPSSIPVGRYATPMKSVQGQACNLEIQLTSSLSVSFAIRRKSAVTLATGLPGRHSVSLSEERQSAPRQPGRTRATLHELGDCAVSTKPATACFV